MTVQIERLHEFGGAVLVRAAFGQSEADLHPEELVWAETKPPRRRVELVAGRTAIRRALAEAGWTGSGPVLPNPQGRPAMPHGFTGSITHKDGVALAIAAPLLGGRTLGVDSEVLGDRDRSTIAPKVLRPVELARWRATGATWPSLLELFSMKEAVYKALTPHVPRYIGFDECEIDAGGRITMFLAGGEGGFALRGTSRWEGERLVCVAEAVRSTTQ